MNRVVQLTERMPWDAPAYDAGSDPSLDGFFGQLEIRALEKLPTPLQVALAEEAQDPEFLAYLVAVLRTPDPYNAIMDAMAKEMAAEQMGLDGYLGYVGMDGLDHLGKSFFKRVGSAIKRVAKKVIIDPHKKVFAAVKKIEKKVVRGAERVWRKYGNIILTVVGGVLSIFVGPAAMAAASVLIAANTMYRQKKAADAAKKAAKKDAAAQQAEADRQTAEVTAQVDKFYQDNQAWFVEHGITPDKWAQLTLDQKIDIINAGAKGTLPVGIGPVVDQNTGQPVTTPGTSPGTGPPAGGAGPAAQPSGGAPPSGATWGGGGGGGPAPGGYAPGGGEGGGGEPGYGPPPGSEGSAPAAAQPDTFALLIEGQQAGTFTKLEDAAKAALAMTKPGDRFEVIAGGKSTGLRVRTSSGSIDVPPDMEAQVRAMSRDKMGEFVAQAEKETKGGIPWGWIILAAGGAAKITGII
jgi:hypothetical protein